MAAPTTSSGAEAGHLTATYTSPTNQSFTVSESLDTPTSDKVEDKQKYLGDLRRTVVSVQDQINKELTQRMEEDKARDAAAKNGKASKKAVDEAKEEENYGEEAQDEED